ncbi:MAG: DUF6146 family protein [Cyclobacteriaceae bacterium]
MKKIFFVLFAFLAACASKPGTTVQKPIDPDIAIKTDEEEEEYDIIIDDPGFDSWLLTNGDANFEHTNKYYKSWNERYVSYWNSNFNNQINYDYSKDYGYEVNYKLFHYFQFVQARYGIDLPGRIR